MDEAGGGWCCWLGNGPERTYVLMEAHTVFIDEHCQLREGRVADLMLPMNLKASKNAGKEPYDRLTEKIPPNNLERQTWDRHFEKCGKILFIG
ncbi:hypothetical protein EYF80_038243 [Liparis tanakae]|uniref:Uncharacterized protein n=1 Tax=Liparis tanakae TaxID=230148 RepID=A0A4Z2GFQ7_9TELE|nr:hypothetical protein EYF80_038243 [Liparis tanakae]